VKEETKNSQKFAFNVREFVGLVELTL